MDKTEKSLLKNAIKLKLSTAKITIDDLKKIKKDERKDFVEIKLLEVNDACLRWALKNKIIAEDELKTNKFFTENSRLSEYLLSGGIAGAAVGAGAAAYTATVTTSFLGLFSSTVTATTIAATAAAPVAVAAVGMAGVKYYKEDKEKKRLIEYFESEKAKVLSFYLNKIDEMKLIENKNGTN